MKIKTGGIQTVKTHTKTNKNKKVKCNETVTTLVFIKKCVRVELKVTFL